MTTTDLIIEGVARNAALLDERCPGWEDRIDLAQLNMGTNRGCLLGQLYGSYSEGRAKLALPISGIGYGFVLFAVGTGSKTGPIYLQLTEAWRELIARRRLAQQQPAETREMVTTA